MTNKKMATGNCKTFFTVPSKNSYEKTLKKMQKQQEALLQRINLLEDSDTPSVDRILKLTKINP